MNKSSKYSAHTAIPNFCSREWPEFGFGVKALDPRNEDCVFLDLRS